MEAICNRQSAFGSEHQYRYKEIHNSEALYSSIKLVMPDIRELEHQISQVLQCEGQSKLHELFIAHMDHCSVYVPTWISWCSLEMGTITGENLI